jgi:hypothetical protein
VLANGGAAVVVNDLDEEAAATVAAQIADAGGRAVTGIAATGSTPAAEMLVDCHREGGWAAAEIAAVRQTTFADMRQPFGVELPRLQFGVPSDAT